LREIPNPVTVVHFEPVGWQRFRYSAANGELNDMEAFRGDRSEGAAGRHSSVVENAAGVVAT